MDSSLMTAQYLDEVISVLKKHQIVSFSTKDFTVVLPSANPPNAFIPAQPDFDTVYKQRVQEMYGN